MLLRKIVLFCSFLTIFVLLSGCAGPDGDAYQSYSWTEPLIYLWDMNPSTPRTVYNGRDYKTNPGSFYMEYATDNEIVWFALYTIKVNKGEAFFQAGADSYLRIRLNGSGPVIERRGVTDGINSDFDVADIPFYVDRASEPKKGNTVPGPVLGTQEVHTARGSIYMQFGQVVNR